MRETVRLVAVFLVVAIYGLLAAALLGTLIGKALS